MFSYDDSPLDNFETFKSLVIKEAFEEGKIKNREFLTKVIRESHNYLQDNIEEKEISFDVYELVMKIVAPEKKYLRNYLLEINPNEIKNEDLVTLVTVLYSLEEDDI